MPSCKDGSMFCSGVTKAKYSLNCNQQIGNQDHWNVWLEEKVKIQAKNLNTNQQSQDLQNKFACDQYSLWKCKQLN